MYLKNKRTTMIKSNAMIKNENQYKVKTVIQGEGGAIFLELRSIIDRCLDDEVLSQIFTAALEESLNEVQK